MANYTYTSGRPAGNISPAAQRASMQDNNDHNALIWEEDHYGFNDNDGGTHQFVRIPNVVAPGAPTGEGGAVSTTITNVSSTNKAQLIFRNSETTVPLSVLRAFCVFNATTGTGAKTLINSYNVSSVNRSALATIDITLPANVLNGTSYLVQVTPSDTVGFNTVAFKITRSSATLIQLTTNGNTIFNNIEFNVTVLQF